MLRPALLSHLSCSGPLRRVRRSQTALSLVAALLLGVGLAACGGNSPPSASSDPPTPAGEVAVNAPTFDLQGCTYVLEGTIPPGEPAGVPTNFHSFAPDQTATAAEVDIKKHGGLALSNGFNVPGGIRLYAGPDLSKPSVATIPSNYQVLVAEPVIWKDPRGETWAAFFISCGGSNLYWVNLDQVEHENPQAAEGITPLLVKSALQPITIVNKNFAWKGAYSQLIIGRGEMWGPAT